MGQNTGLNKSRNPSSIANQEHHDSTGAHRSSHGELLAIDKVIATSSAATAIKANATLRVCNTSATVQYLWAGQEDQDPGTLNATNSIALPPNHVGMIFTGRSENDQKSMVVKASDVAVQIVVMKS